MQDLRNFQDITKNYDRIDVISIRIVVFCALT